jgi:hypothetical protein
MRKLAMALGLALLLAACGQPAAGPVRTTSVPAQLVDDPDEIPVAGPVSPDPRVGPIFLGGRNLHTCTGSVVHSSGGDLILTAAHCLAKGFTTTFVPGFANTAAPTSGRLMPSTSIHFGSLTKIHASTTPSHESAAPAADRSRRRSAPH